MSRRCDTAADGGLLSELFAEFRSPLMHKVREKLLPIVKTSIPVFLGGETGVGKSEIAQRIAKASGLDGPFVRTAFPTDTLIEASLFGHKKGSFNGATNDRIGFLKAADTGTLFIDEIDRISHSVQALLLVYLDSKKFCPVGTTESETSTCRLISAANRPLKLLERLGLLRADFIFRLAGIAIEIPPLRERKEDIAPIARSILHKLDPDTIYEITDDALRRLEGRTWPGNIRQLKSSLEVTVAHLSFYKPSSQIIDVDDLYLESWVDDEALTAEEEAFLALAAGREYSQKKMATIARSESEGERWKTPAAVNAYLRAHPLLRSRFDELKAAFEDRHGRSRRRKAAPSSRST